MKPRTPFLPCLRLLLSLYAATAFTGHGAEISARWILQGIGDWNDSANWTNGIVPVNNSPDQYDVTIQISPNDEPYVQASLDGDMAVSRLTLSEELYVYDSASGVRRQFQVQNEFHWLGGALNGWRTDYHLHGNAFFEGNTVKTLDRQCSLTIHDQATWLKGTLAWKGYGSVRIGSNASLTLNTGGTIGTSATTDSASVTNYGTVRMNASGATAKFYGSMMNWGLLDLQAGNVQFNDTFINAGAIHIAAGSRLIIGYAWGYGIWRPFTFTGGGEIVLFGTQQLPVDMTFPCQVRMAGDIFGPGNLTVSNAVWEAGPFSGPGSLLIPPGGKLTITNQASRLDSIARNAGDIYFAPNSRLNSLSLARMTNASSGVMHFAGGASLTLPSIHSYGSIQKDDGNLGPATLGSWLYNEGNVLSTAGQLNLAGGTNRGTLTAQSPGSILAQAMAFGDSSQLIGNGLIALSGCTLRGSVSPSLAISLSGTRVAVSQNYVFKSLQVGDVIGFVTNYGAEITDDLYMRGGLDKGTLRSLNRAELSFSTASLSGGSLLDLAGQSTWIQGTLTIQQSNTVFLNRSALRVQGITTLRVQSGASFVNQSNCVFSRQIGSVNGTLSDSVFQWTTGNLSGEATLEDGPFQITGPVTFAPQSLVAGPEARIVFSTFGITNAQLSLIQSSLETTTALTGSNIVLRLDRSSVTGPPRPWVGQATLSGNGSFAAQLSVRTLELAAVPGTNDLTLNGSLAFAGASATCRIRPLTTNNAIMFPHLTVHGPVTLAGKFEIAVPFAANGSNLLTGPITLLTADQPITGNFANATNGAVVILTNGFRCRLYFGPNSPYGVNTLVMTDFGSAFDQWRLQRFTAQEMADPDVSGPDADADKNGFNNTAEFVWAFDLGPTNFTPTVIPGADGYTRIHLRRRKDIGNFEATLSVSTNLQSWLSAPVGNSPAWLPLHRAYDLGGYYDYKYLYQGTPPSFFLRLSVTGQP